MKVAFTLLYVFCSLSVFGFSEEEASREIVWRFSSQEANEVLAGIFSYPENIQHAASVDCYVKVVRPRMGFSPIVHAKNEATCTMTAQDGTQKQVSWDLSTASISGWGNRFAPKGFSLTGPHAELLYLAMERFYQRAESTRYFRSRSLHLASVSSVLEWDEYAISNDAPASPETWPLNCTRYYLFSADTSRPGTPTETRCDFVYQWKVIPGDLF